MKPLTDLFSVQLMINSLLLLYKNHRQFTELFPFIYDISNKLIPILLILI